MLVPSAETGLYIYTALPTGRTMFWWGIGSAGGKRWLSLGRGSGYEHLGKEGHVRELHQKYD